MNIVKIPIANLIISYIFCFIGGAMATLVLQDIIGGI